MHLMNIHAGVIIIKQNIKNKKLEKKSVGDMLKFL